MTNTQEQAEITNFRTREMQIRDAFTYEGEKFNFLDEMNEEGFKAALIEAEARGAAEQRQKDAENCMKAPDNAVPRTRDAQIAELMGAFRGVTHVDGSQFLTHMSENDLGNALKEAEARGAANVGVLEARIRELEEEVRLLKTPQQQLFVEDEDAYNSPEEAVEFYDPDTFQVIKLKIFALTGFLWVFCDGEKVHEFPTEEAARDAAKTMREGSKS